jgi:RimJ/RimL family protein N-acetyltransferase
MAVFGAEVEVRLHPMSLATAAGLVEGRRVVVGPPWHPAYPLPDTLVGVRLLVDAHRAAGWEASVVPPWWIHQVVADGVVVGDIGFHGPPSVDGVVEIGYALVEPVHGRGIATAACLRLLSLAWRDGAAAVVAEATPDNPASRRVLAKAGFVLRDDGVFEARP